MNQDYEDYLYAFAIFAMLLALILMMPISHAQELTVEQKIELSAKKHGIDPTLALAIAEVESQMNPAMVGSLGEIGIYQLRPEYHYVVRGNIDQNINTAMHYLVVLKRQCEEYREAFFICFNTGPNRRVRYPKKFPYYRKVKRAQDRRIASMS